MDDLEIVDYHNDTSVTDLVPVRKLETIKEDENDYIEVIKTAQRVVISNDNDNVEFLKQIPLHPRDRLKRSEKKYLQTYQKKLIQRSKNHKAKKLSTLKKFQFILVNV